MEKFEDESLITKKLSSVTIGSSSKDFVIKELIPGLPNDLALICLAKISHGFHGLLKCVCKRWRDVLRSKEYASCKLRMGCCGDWLFAWTGGIKSHHHQWKAYDPEADRWHTIPHIPGFDGARHVGFSCVSVCNRFLVIGRAYIDNHGALVTSRVFSFDPFSQEWSEVASMSTPRAYFACSVVCGKVYVGGGGSSFLNDVEPGGEHFYITGEISSAEVYDPVKDRWDDLPAMPNPKMNCFGVSYDNKFYVLNTEFSYSNRDTMEVFSPCERQWHSQLDEWQKLNNLSSGVVVINGHMYTLNGLQLQGEERDSVEIWNGETGDWHLVGLVPGVTLTEHPSFRSFGYNICGLRNKLYFIGGYAIRHEEIRGTIVMHLRILMAMRFCNPSITPLQWVQTRPAPKGDGDAIIACTSLEEGLH